VHAQFDIYVFYIYCWVDTSAGGLLVHVDIIRPVVSASALIWFIRYILLSKFNVISIKAKVIPPQS
jgi:hypothetical protein